MPLKINSSGGGSVTIDAPVTASNLTMTAPSAAGTLATTDQLAQFGFKNRIINGAMMIDQRNAGAAVTPTASYAYCLDRWSYGLSQSSKLTFQQSTTAPVGFSNSLKVTVASAFSPAASDRFILFQPIEGFNVADLAWGTANARSIAISFQVYSSITGTFSCALSNSSGTQSYAFSYSVSSANTWTTITATVPGSTTGSWNLGTNSAAIYLYFNLGDGTNFLGSPNTWSSSFIEGVTGQTSLVANAGATFYITGVQLEVGSTATSFDYRPYGTELQLCQRYYYQISYSTSAATSMIGFSRASNVCYFNLTNPVIMRTTPTVAFTGTAPAWNDGANNYTLNSPTALDTSFNNAFYALMTGATAYRPGNIFGGGGGSGATTFSSEL